MPASVFAPPFVSADALRAEEDALVLRLVAVLLLLACCGSLYGDTLCRHRYQEVAVVAPDDPECLTASAHAPGGEDDDMPTGVVRWRAVAVHGVAVAALSSGGASSEADIAARVADRGTESDEDDWYEL